METVPLHEENESVFYLENEKYSYRVQPFEMHNSLGNAVAVLSEYIITDNSGNVTHLFRTNEGSWYDFNTPKTVAENAEAWHLKSVIEGLIQL